MSGSSYNDTNQKEEAMSTNKVTVAEAAKHLGVAQQFVRLGLQRKELP